MRSVVGSKRNRKSGDAQDDGISVTFTRADGSSVTASGEEGMSLLQLAQENGLDVEGTCEGNMACSTCHMIVASDFYHLLPVMSEEEEDMLDLAIGLCSTSRLGCQVLLKDDMDGLCVQLPGETRNMMGL